MTALPVTALGEIESRLGIPALESLHAERRTLIDEAGPLRARHSGGNQSPWEALRKIEWCRIASLMRAQALAETPPRKVTEAQLEQDAHADPRYLAFVVQGIEERERLNVLEDRILGIEELVNRGQAIARYLSAELGLAR